MRAFTQGFGLVDPTHQENYNHGAAGFVAHGLRSMGEFVTSCFRVFGGLSWKALCLASNFETQSEFDLAANRLSSLQRIRGDDFHAKLAIECELWGTCVIGVLALVRGSQHIRSLSASGVRRLFEYRQKCLLKGYCIDNFMCTVGQDTVIHCQTNASDIVSTTISSVAIVWANSLGRWFTFFELLVGQGLFPYPCVYSCGEQIEFSAHRPGRSRHEIIHQAGNSMHAQVIGLSLLWCAFGVSSKQRIQLSSLLQRV